MPLWGAAAHPNRKTIDIFCRDSHLLSRLMIKFQGFAFPPSKTP
jgi:hypothetical protein